MQFLVDATRGPWSNRIPDIERGILLLVPAGAVCRWEKRDSLTVGQLEGEAEAAFLGGAKKLIFDLAGVNYVASPGLRVFVMAMMSFPGKVFFAALQPHVRETFRINALDKHATVCPTLAEALKA